MAVGPVGTAAGFEDDDGNLVKGTSSNTTECSTTPIDWNCFKTVSWQPSPSQTPTRQTTDLTKLGWKFKGIEDWGNNGSDSVFAGGTKQDNECATVQAGPKPPNKDDLKRIYLASATVSGHTYLMLAWDRIPQNTTSPSAHIGFEFNKATATSGPCGGSSGGLVHRTAGDLLIVYDFEGGSTDLPTLTIRKWVTDPTFPCDVGSNQPPCWGYDATHGSRDLTADGFAEGRVNTASTALDQLAPPALTSTSGTSTNDTLGLNEFGEAGIDLTGAGIFTAGTCESFGTAYAVSRSSGNSAQAQMKDLVGPAPFSLTNCGEIKIIKHTNPRGLNQPFGFTSTGLGASGITCTKTLGTGGGFSLNDNGNTSGDSTANTQDCTNVPVGTYTVTEGANPSGFTFNNFSCTSSGGASATPSSSTTQKNVSISMVGGGLTTCTYTNDQQLGAIQVTKTRKHAADGSGDHPQAGVSFTVNGVTKQTDANGIACFDGLTFRSYVVHETVPAGYHVDGNDKSVTVDNNASCSDSTYVGETVAFHNTPLTDITVSVNSQVDGGTASTISCVDGNDNPVGTTVSTGADGDGSKSMNNREPDTYVCTVVVDP